ncbi:MAG: phage tail fiber protein [Actinomycetota bacterium]|nr:phage tail fiber protein [Actinomycetota bacterium]
MSASKQLYTGDGVQTQYNIPFPFIDITHVKVHVDLTMKLIPADYSISGSTITFVNPPGDGSAIEVFRRTSPTTILVDFHDGSTLGENELDTAYLHNFYLGQEYSDSFNELINNAFLDVATDVGITEVETPALLTALVAEMLTQEAAATLQQRVDDIDLNAEAILDLGTGLQVQVNVLAQGTAAIVYVQDDEPIPGQNGIPDPIADGARWYDSNDNNKPYIYDVSITTWLSLEDPRIGQAVADISVLQTDVDDNAAAVVTEATARSTEDTAFASLLALIGAQNGAQTAFIIDTATVKIDSDAGDTFSARFSSLASTDSTNAASISTEQSARIAQDGVIATLISLLGAENGAQTAFILNEDTVKIASDGGDTLAERFAALVASDATNAASVATEQSARISADNTLTGNVSANASSITDLQVTIDLRARTFFQATQPTADNVGDLWIDSDDDTLWRWSGADWVNIQDAAIAANAAATTNLTADVEANDTDIAVNAASIVSLGADATTLAGRVTTAEANIGTNVSAIANSEGDISANATSISSLEAEVDLRATVFLQAAAPTANNVGDLWIDSDDNLLYRWNGTTWAALQDIAIAGNATAITNLTADVVANDGDIAVNVTAITDLDAEIVTVDGRVDSANINISANVSAISDSEDDIVALFAHYGVTLNVNGYITGFALNNDGETGDFVIVSDKFAIVTPDTLWTATAAKSLGDMVRPTTSNDRVFKCTTAGTTGASEPTWDTVIGNDTNDGSVVWETVDDVPIIPFAVQDGVVIIQNLEVAGSLIVAGSISGNRLINGTIGSTQIGANAITTTQLNADSVTAIKIQANTITADKMSVTELAAITADIGAITAGSIVLDNSGFIRGGQTGYNTGSGFFLGYDTADYKFSIGDGGIDNYITWDGTSLVIRGNVSIGQYDASNVIMLSADTERTNPNFAWEAGVKSFSLNRPGTVRITFDVKVGSIVNGLITDGEYRVRRDGTIVATGSFSTTSYVGKTHDITMLTGSSGLTVDTKGGLRDAAEPVASPALIRNCRIKADKSDGESVLTD